MEQLANGGLRRPGPGDRILLLLGLVALALIGAVAIVSPVNPVIHPDEAFHVAAYRYYATHVAPPALDSPEVAATLSGYGYSYLFELDLVYALAAWTTRPVDWIIGQPMLAARAFNVALFAAVLVAMWRRPAWSPALALALVTPQTWYVFSYFNADALPLAAGLLLAAMAGQPDGAISRYLSAGERRPWAVLSFAALLALLFLSKRNYLPLVAALVLFLAIVHVGVGWVSLVAALTGVSLLCLSVFAHDIPTWSGSAVPSLVLAIGASSIALSGALLLAEVWLRRERWPMLKRLLILIGIAVALAAPRIAWELATNGSPSTRADTITQIMEERAVPSFKPSVVATGSGYEGRDVAARGVTLEQMLFVPYRWFDLSIGSAFGVYGYLNVFAPDGLYVALMATFAALAMLAVFAAVQSRGMAGAKLALAMIVFAAIVVVISIMHSWTFDLQRQGRYLFPILPLIAVLVGAAGRRTRAALMVILFLAGSLSIYSYAAIALPFAVQA